MNDVSTRIIVCCYLGRIGTHHSLFYRTYGIFRRICIIQQL